MLFLHQRIPSFSQSNSSDLADSNSVDPFTGLSLDCSTPGVKLSRTAQIPSDIQPIPFPRGRISRRLSENERARISIYLRLLNAMLALVISTMKTFGKQTASAMDLVKTKGASEILYLVGIFIQVETL